MEGWSLGGPVDLEGARGCWGCLSQEGAERIGGDEQEEGVPRPYEMAEE